MERILLVEDDGTIVATLSQFLRAEGFSVQTAPGQAQALAQLFDVLRHDFLNRYAKASSKFCDVPAYIAQFLCHVIAIKFVPLIQIFFVYVGDFASLAAQT